MQVKRENKEHVSCSTKRAQMQVHSFYVSKACIISYTWRCYYVYITGKNIKEFGLKEAGERSAMEGSDL